MKSIRVSKSVLLDKLQLNRESHRKIFLEAQEGYRAAAIAAFEEMLAEARSGKRIRRHVDLIEPRDQTRDYDRVIAMLGMSEDESVELTENDFQFYVLDDWGWKRQFLVSNSNYSATAMRLSAEMSEDDERF